MASFNPPPPPASGWGYDCVYVRRFKMLFQIYKLDLTTRIQAWADHAFANIRRPIRLTEFGLRTQDSRIKHA